MGAKERYFGDFGKLWKIAAAILTFVTAVVVAFGVQDSRGMISYYCVTGNPFLGIHFQDYAGCSVYVAIGWISCITLVFLFVLLVLALLLDFLSFTFRMWYARITSRMVYSYDHARQVQISLGHAIVKNGGKREIIISVHNSELFLRAEGVHVETRYVYRDSIIEGRIKWLEEQVKNGEISISNGVFERNSKTLHFATVYVGDENFDLHLMDGDRTYPKGELSYRFPIDVFGTMIYPLTKTPRMILRQHFEVIVDYKGKDDISVRIKT